MSRILVLLQFVLPAILVFSTRPTTQHVFGLTLVACGIAMEVWAIVTMGPRRVSVMPEVRSDAQLITSGPYRFIRNPMYTALFMAGLGLALSPSEMWRLGVAGALGGVLVAKAAIEERQLREKFTDYGDYAAKTKRFIPFLW